MYSVDVCINPIVAILITEEGVVIDGGKDI